MSTIAIIAPSSVPFQIGGAEKFWWGLHKGLTESSGAFVELLKWPCREESFRDIVASYRTFSELDLSHFDMVISTKYPAWMVKHSNHVVYMQHTLRGLYDTYHFTGLPEMLVDIPASLRELMSVLRKPSPSREDLAHAFELLERAQETKSLSPSLFAFPGPLIREVVHFFDRVALAPSQVTAYAAISATVRNRKDYFPPDVDVKIIHHPSDIVDFQSRQGEYIFTASRLTNMKRLHLIVEAMQYVSEDIPLRIAGTGSELDRLKSLAGNDRRIEFLGHVSDAQLPSLYSAALFVPFVPYDEDYGLITIEAMRSGKTVVTVNDAGGVCEFVENGVTGYCVEPTPEALGTAMQRLGANPDLARELGQNAKKRVENITWASTVEAVLTHAHRSATVKASHGRSKVVVVNPFSVKNPVSGGQRRVHALCAELAKMYFVELVCLGSTGQSGVQQTVVLPFFYEICLPCSRECAIEEEFLNQLTGASTGDLACMKTCENDARLLEELNVHMADAEVVILSHPYLYPAVCNVLNDVPLVYDAHNVEADMKAVVLADYFDKSALIAQVADTEKKCCDAAMHILSCSAADGARFSELYGLSQDKILVISNGYDALHASYTDRAQRTALKKRLGYADVTLALFMGSLHRPNSDAVNHIKTIASAVPEMQFLIVGSVANTPGIRNDAPNNVQFLGVIAEKEKHVLLSIADIALNPVTSGSGTNLKIVEYIAVGVETVSTPFGLRGLEDDVCLRDAVHVADIDEFASILQNIMRTQQHHSVLESAAAHVSANFSWDRVMKPVTTTVGNLIAHRKKVASCL